nr:ABC transporter ATP-binding protein [uncultured Cellulosilyticum sp.]
MKEIAIKIDNISKIYKLYDKTTDRLKESLSITKKKYYKEHYALRNISFDVNKGETVGIIGTNGAGKSTLLKIITGVLSPTEGELKVNGRISALLELGAGFNMEYTGIENIYLNGTMQGYTRQEIEDRIDEIIGFADIGEFINQPVKTYSSGMFVRLAFAVAINIEPEILIVDEALSVGDVFFQAKCYKKFEEFKKQGKTIIFVSHDLSSIAKYCDRTILLNKGTFLAEGSSREIVDMYKKLLVNQLDGADEKKGEIKEKKPNLPEEVEWKKHIQINPNKIEYGNKKAEIIDFGIFDEYESVTTTIVKQTTFSIKMRIKFNERVCNPIFAFTLRDIKGTDITGTNTMLEKVDTLERTENDIVEISFKQVMSLQGGDYLVQLGCTGFEAGEFTVYHRLYDICNINVIADKSTVGFYDMDSKIELKKL